MSIFQCERCGCAENTAAGVGMFHYSPSSFDWSYAPELKGKRLCSVCGPRQLANLEMPTITRGEWHGLFPRVFLPMGMFHTDSQGNLKHNETGEGIRKYELRRHKFPVTRPVIGRKILAWSETDEYLGEGMSLEFAKSGVGILLQTGKGYDSNHVLYWSYAE